MQFFDCIFAPHSFHQISYPLLLFSFPLPLIWFCDVIWCLTLPAGSWQTRICSLGRSSQGLFDWIDGLLGSSSPFGYLSLLEPESTIWETTQGCRNRPWNLPTRHTSKAWSRGSGKNSRSKYKYSCRRGIQSNLDDRLRQWMVWKGRRWRHLR